MAMHHFESADRKLHQFLVAGKSPSVQYILFDQNAILHRYSEGLARIREGMSVDWRTGYHFYSTTKTFTGLAIMQLVQKGMIQLDQPAKMYLPDFPYGSPIIVRHLLSHTAGIANPIPLSWIHLQADHDGFDGHGFFKTIFEKHPKVNAGPNQRFAYTNLGYILLGWVIEQVTGLSYRQYITENIIRPLGLTPDDLGFDVTNPQQHARGYQKVMSMSNLILGLLLDKKTFMDQTEGAWKPFKPMYVNGEAYGGLVGTPLALVRYLQELLKPDGVLLKDHFKQMMLTENFTVKGKPTGMCLSWFTGRLMGRSFYTHAGGGGGFYVEMRIYPAEGIGSVLYFNRTGISDERLLDQIDAIYFS